MRMRKKKNGAARLDAVREFVLDRKSEPMISPAEEVFSREGAPVWLEIGAGKGGFACGMIEKHPEAVYFAMERVSDCAVLAMEKAKGIPQAHSRLRFIVDTADKLTYIFGKQSIDAIFLNFSDPWSKKGYAKRRLTHRRYLAVYLYLLKDGARIRFKTDNDALFDFTLEEIEAMGLVCDKVTRDLHASPYDEGNVRTEYEENFARLGTKINMLELTKPQGYAVTLPEELSPTRPDYRRGGEE